MTFACSHRPWQSKVGVKSTLWWKGWMGPWLPSTWGVIATTDPKAAHDSTSFDTEGISHGHHTWVSLGCTRHCQTNASVTRCSFNNRLRFAQMHAIIITVHLFSAYQLLKGVIRYLIFDLQNEWRPCRAWVLRFSPLALLWKPQVDLLQKQLLRVEYVGEHANVRAISFQLRLLSIRWASAYTLNTIMCCLSESFERWHFIIDKLCTGVTRIEKFGLGVKFT